MTGHHNNPNLPTRLQAQVIRAVLAVGETDVSPEAVKRQLETDGFSPDEAAAMLAACVADGTVILSVPSEAQVLQFPGRGRA